MKSDNLRIAIVSGAVSIICAAIGAFAVVYPAAKTARASASNAAISADAAEISSEKAQAAVAAIPGAVATRCRGEMTIEDAERYGRFNFNDVDFDGHSAIVTGNDWRLIVPVSGTYFVQANFQGPIHGDRPDPYVKAELFRLKDGTATPERIALNATFAPFCQVSGTFQLYEGDQLFVKFSAAEKTGYTISGDFCSVLVGPVE